MNTQLCIATSTKQLFQGSTGKKVYTKVGFLDYGYREQTQKNNNFMLDCCIYFPLLLLYI